MKMLRENASLLGVIDPPSYHISRLAECTSFFGTLCTTILQSRFVLLSLAKLETKVVSEFSRETKRKDTLCCAQLLLNFKLGS